MAVKKVRCTHASLQVPMQRMKQIISINEKDKKAIVIAQEIKFARLLSSNDKIIRDRVLKNLRKWLTVRSQSSFTFTEADFMRLWKGLFYCMWMSDKPLIQEELAESLSKIVHCFKTKDVILLYILCTLKTLGIEWFGIDQYRLDKFCMLVRRIIRQTFQKCKENLWNIEWIKGFSEILEKLLVDPQICQGFNMHITEIFLEELSKISNGNIPEDVVTELIKPFISYFIPMDDERQIRHIMRHIFRYLIFQSDIGIDYMEKFKAWRDAGFPAGSIDIMEKIEISDDEMDDNITEIKEQFLQNQMNCVEKSLDPRAGRIDVDLPQIPFNSEKIAILLNKYKFHPSSTTKSRRQLRHLIQEFTELSEGKMPLGIKEIKVSKIQKKNIDTKSAAIRLLKFENELYMNKLQKRRKRKKNKQLMQNNENNKSSEEELENISDENNSKIESTEIDESEVVKKKRKLKHKLNTTNYLTNTNLQISDKNSLNIKKTKRKIIEKNQNQNISNLKNNYKRKNYLLIENTDENKKIKLKKNKNTTVKTLNIITQAKRKKSTKLKNTGKWNVSDHIEAPICSLNNKNTKSCPKIVSNSVMNNHEQENDILNKKPIWLMPILTKLKNEKNNKSLKEQHKIRTTTNSKKRVKIALQCNTAQHTSEYISQIRKSPAIPFDANKKPLAGVLKASPIPSPINPFYKRNIL
ncbi:ribosomal RNA processing protein 1 homolog [Apis cerana]|uniref:Ribosomal RNA processing protein n=1 Tax=Apis cerana cerana TaxID=94128 RepID=A0A2A3EHT1_APICC|nr:ribosomal RNA processing protein 1 homolog [Apis cerana]PBC31335.1 Ribosomal RNA processing protein [Apis cerana cerana]